jgi:hypothetical protein
MKKDDNEKEPIEVVELDSFTDKLRNITLAIMMLMISLGQWNDTKDILIAGYEEVVSRFTNQVEYERLNKLRVGFTQEYVGGILGAPSVIRHSKVLDGLDFYYYDSDKFLLITFMKGSRLSGFSVITKQDDFFAPIPYINKKLNKNTMPDYFPSQGNVLISANNIEYFAETYEFGRNLMFYNFALGIVKYDQETTLMSKKIREINRELDRGRDVDVEELNLSASIQPNFFAISELSNDVIFESLLSQYEMATLFGSQNN